MSKRAFVLSHRADAEEFDLDQFASEIEVSSSADSDADSDTASGAFHAATRDEQGGHAFKFQKRRKAAVIIDEMHTRSKIMAKIAEGLKAAMAGAGAKKLIELGMRFSTRFLALIVSMASFPRVSLTHSFSHSPCASLPAPPHSLHLHRLASAHHPDADSDQFTEVNAGALAAPDVCTPPNNFKGFSKKEPFKGCISPANIVEYTIDKAVSAYTSGNDDASAWIKTFVAPAVDVFINKGDASSALKDASFCMSSWNGTEIAESLNGAPEDCAPMPLNPDSNYLLVSLIIPGSWLPPTCPVIRKEAETTGSKAGICLAIGSCNGKPTGFLGLTGPALGCIVESAAGVASGGIATAASAGIAGAISFAGAGFSVGADLYLEVPFWNFGEPGVSKVYGHVAAVMAIDLGAQFSGVLGLSDDSSKFFVFEGACTFIVRFPTLGGNELTAATDEVKKDNKGWMQKIKKLLEFQVALVAHVTLGFTFSQSSNEYIAVLPDFPPIKLAQISGLISTVDPKISGVDRGAYFLVTTGNLLGTILANLAGWCVRCC